MPTTRFHVVFRKLDEVLAEEFVQNAEDINGDFEAVERIRETIEGYSEPQLIKFTSTC